MRSGVSWSDVCILNLSPRGVGIQAPTPPQRGSYVEICRGSHVIVARVVWARGHRAGLHAQDVIWPQSLINEPEIANDRAPPVPGSMIDRRSAHRASQRRHDGSRTAARAMEMACIAAFGAALSFGAFGLVHDALARPLSEIRSALG